jgi:hypothetical protein
VRGRTKGEGNLFIAPRINKRETIAVSQSILKIKESEVSVPIEKLKGVMVFLA